jgi:ubiquinone/menaquinone biosynthesis C-methylase UbiE
MLRHVPEFAPKAELWGVDISAQHVQWCVNNLTPPMHFATTTTIPHLPFEDRYFDLVFCGSVFTHIEDMQQSWLLELGRVLRPLGKLFMTIHDEHTVALLDTSSRDHSLAKMMREQDVYASKLPKCSRRHRFSPAHEVVCTLRRGFSRCGSLLTVKLGSPPRK